MTNPVVCQTMTTRIAQSDERRVGEPDLRLSMPNQPRTPFSGPLKSKMNFQM